MKRQSSRTSFPWWLLPVVGLAVLAVAGLGAVLLFRRPAADESPVRGSERGVGPTVPRFLAGDSPEQAIEEFFSAYAEGRYEDAKERMTLDFLGLFSLMGGFEQKSEEVKGRLGDLVRWEVLSLYPADPDEAMTEGERQTLIRLSWSRGEIGCSIYRLAPPAITGDHWRLNGYYRNNVPCPEE